MAKSRVHFEDLGTVYDAPVDVVWDFMLRDEEFHPKAHRRSLRGLKWEEQNEITTSASFETFRAGRWIRRKSRITTIPPMARILEELEGPYAGSKIVFLYTPKGRKTGVDVFAELASDTLSAEQLEREWRETLAGAFEEDLPMFRKFVRARKRSAGRKPQRSLTRSWDRNASKWPEEHEAAQGAAPEAEGDRPRFSGNAVGKRRTRGA